MPPGRDHVQGECPTGARTRPDGPRRSRSLGQSGFGLVEVVITVFLAGVVVLGLAAGLLTLVRTNAATDERQRIDQALGNVAEGLKALPYVPCTDGGGPDAADLWADYQASATSWSPPAGMTVQLLDVEYWDRSERRFVGTCAEGDQGAQQVTISVDWRDRTGTAQVVVGSR